MFISNTQPSKHLPSFNLITLKLLYLFMSFPMLSFLSPYTL